ncbi:hypothetical protein KUCAC02_025452 [Chaenocephalus aceratus]|uniref:Uncharacterized protein n=1 Tax=Chaenocephalus aceratus TaxID=36190 RepID=A0ACB9VUK2_CHAAC|nr:hypothetical protein KUCAC02_025452 [Chaenocephalus aceratus]
METQKKRGQGCWGGRQKPSRDPASAVGRPTAAVDVELSGPGTEALTVTDKRQAGSVKSTWHRAAFSLADAKSMTEALAGGQAGGRPLALFPPLG